MKPTNPFLTPDRTRPAPYVDPNLNHRDVAPEASGTTTVQDDDPVPEASASDPATLEDLLHQARVLKAKMDLDKAEYDGLKAKIWDAVGRKICKLPGGGAFRRKNKTRRTDLKRLEADHPDIYADYVTVTEPDPNEPGALYL